MLDVLAGKGSHASQSLQSFIPTSNSQLYLHITVCGRQPSQGGCTRGLVLAGHPEVCSGLGVWQLCWEHIIRAGDGAIAATLLGKDAVSQG